MPVVSVAADDVGALRAELQAMKDEYGARVDALEARIQQLEASSGASTASAEPAAPASGDMLAGNSGSRMASASNPSAFNPSISLVLGGSYTHTARDPEDWNIAGFPSNGGEIGPGERSFNLGESELTVSASIDPYFSGVLTAAITADNEIEVEEAFVRTTALHGGFTLKGGRFFSGFGYLNEIHAHAWDFNDQPLVYQAMFGGQFRQNGLQVKWLAPTDLFLEFGAETGNGDGFPATRLESNGFNGATLFAHVGGDLGAAANWRAGAAWLTQEAENREGGPVDQTGVTAFDSFTGDSQTWVFDGVFKWQPSSRRELVIQGEYMSRRDDGTYLFDPAGLAALTNYRNTQSGWYLQGVYQFTPRWRAGARFDSLDSGRARYTPVGLDPPIDFGPPLPALHPERVSLMLDWSPSEFSRLRAQYDWDDARVDGDSDRIFRLQYIYGLGAHGAHKY
jgi:hypothetical protein